MAASIRVLHVDDDPDFASLTADLLEAESDRIGVVTETDPNAGVEQVGCGDVDCVVSDYDMPGMDGLDVLERVRAIDPDLPFILFTGKGSEEVASDALSIGATDYLQKEVGTDQYAILANRIENAVRQRRSVAALERQDEILAEAQKIAALGVCEYDVETGEVWFSEGLHREFGIPDGTDSGATDDLDLEEVLSFYYQGDRETLEAALAGTLQDGEPFDLACRLATDGDRERWVRIRGKPEVEDGDVRRVRATVQDVTDRRERERELRRAERRFEAVFEDPHMLVGVLDADGTHRKSNEVAMAYVDADHEDLRGVPFWETPWWDDAREADVREWVERAADGEYVTYEARTTDATGTPLHVEGSVRPVRDEAGDVGSLVVSARDVTGQAASDWEQFYEALVAETTDAIALVDETGEVRYGNPAIESMLGYDLDDVLGESLVEYVHPDDRERVSEWFEALSERGDSATDPIEYRVPHADGSWRWLESRARKPDGTTLDGYVVTSRDVTERREREREREGRERIIEGIGQSLFALNADGEFTYVNEVGASLSGYDPEELLDGGPELLHPVTAIETFERNIRDLLASDPDGVRTVEVLLETRSGETIPVEVTLTVQTDESGNFTGTVGILTDVSEQRAIERELREHRSILRALPDEVVILDTDGYVTRIIPPGDAELTPGGYRPEELEGEHVSTVMTEADLERASGLIEELLTSDRERAAFEMEIVSKDGERLLREDHLALLEDDDGSVRGSVGVLRNIEARKERERKLQRQNERLEKFASIASHDLRNPLNLVDGYLDLVADDCESEYVGRAREGLERMERVIDDTLTWARQGGTVDDPEPLDLGALARDCWESVGDEACHLEVIDEVTVTGDRSRVRRVFENLLRNAVEHGGEDVTVRFGAIGDEGFYVEDGGPGILPEDRESVFDVGFSIASEGTGFGLAIIAEIVEAHGWEIAATESEAGGARFEITGAEVS